MGSFRYPGPVCRTRMVLEDIADGTLVRARSPVPSLLPASQSLLTLTVAPPACAAPADSLAPQLRVPALRLSQFQPATPSVPGAPLQVPFGLTIASGPRQVATRTVARGKCAYLNPESQGRVKVPKEVFDRLRELSSAARISEARRISKTGWAKASEWPDPVADDAIYHEIVVDAQTLRVIRPTDSRLQGKNLPSIKQLAEALRVVPKDQRALTKTVLVRGVGRDGLRGLGGNGEIEVFPFDLNKDSAEYKSYHASPQTYFDNLVTHECAHNFQGKFWHGAEDVTDWQAYADADRARPSPYSAENAGEDFCEFMVLYNAAVGTPCEEMLQKVYPNRWQRLAEYKAA